MTLVQKKNLRDYSSAMLRLNKNGYKLTNNIENEKSN